MSGMNEFASKVVESNRFRQAVVCVIILNAIIIGLETYPSIEVPYGIVLDVADTMIIILFTVELCMRFVAEKNARAFFNNPWNIFDVAIIAIGYLPAYSMLTVLRLFRIIRIMRTFTVIPALKKIVSALLRSLPTMSYVLVLMGLLVYVYAVVGTFLFGSVAPDSFGSLHRTILTLFGVLTLEGWVGLMQTVSGGEPFAWVYFVSFILIGTYVLLNFFVGIIVNNMQSATFEETDKDLEEIKAALARIEKRISELPETGARNDVVKAKGR